MISRLFFMAFGLSLIALAVLMYDPAIYGPGAPRLVLGESFESMRPLLIGFVGYMGAVFFIAAAARPWGKPKPPRPTYVDIEIEPRSEPAFAAEPEVFPEAAPEPAGAPTGGPFAGGGARPSPLW